MSNWWVSWYCPAEVMGRFELHSPWWVSGERLADGALTICAAVRARSEDQARLVVVMAHDADQIEWASRDLEWRFVEPRSDDWTPFCRRFERADWMQW